MEHFPPQLVIIVFLFLIFLIILWVLLPFAVFGTKDKLQQIIDETRASRIATEQLIELIKNKSNE